MSGKQIHIVFQVLNFLHSQHHLAKITTPAEHLLLINLASHQGKKGICPSISLVAKELKVTKMTVIRSMQRWEELEILQIQKNIGKRNYYFLSIPLPTSNIHDTGNIHDTSSTNVTGPVTFTTSTSNIGATTYITKEELKKNKEKLLYGKPKNEERHAFADSMDQMACERINIEQHEARKAEEINSTKKVLSPIAERELDKIRDLTGRKKVNIDVNKKL